MLAAGWGGSGSIVRNRETTRLREAPDFHRSSNGYVTDTMSRYQAVSFEDSERLKLERFIDRLNMFQAGLFTPFGDIISISDLKTKGAPEGLVEALPEFVDAGLAEEIVVMVFLYLLAKQEKIKDRLNRSIKIILEKAYEQLSGIPDETQERIETKIELYLQTIECL